MGLILKEAEFFEDCYDTKQCALKNVIKYNFHYV